MLYREYGGTSVVLRFAGAWLLVSAAITLRVRDCRSAYDVLLGRGARFLTPPHDWDGEVRCSCAIPTGI